MIIFKKLTADEKSFDLHKKKTFSLRKYIFSKSFLTQMLLFCLKQLVFRCISHIFFKYVLIGSSSYLVKIFGNSSDFRTESKISN
uniref:Uncharacterized protein n=2 Tax=Pavlovaceae TaxID=418969 RepID=M1KFZ0_DIALT|nr:hypothetical protein H907_pgp001 [Diacronema lutheri]YP_009863850.1 hypothetical protein [Pavlova sp. NIVA-4/92]AGE93825.1 hypothetical protein [Diacronema lutheri]QKE31181.1 hypothetical protein [Pavlova sp. NIVA-4/92]|mmetsp:Transcript_12959/g.40709  ORF Transcript_12959/g.40709 Transcript_12959/m.40709 type:complete len:85 (+) Transcript_12959:506-760(+)